MEELVNVGKAYNGQKILCSKCNKPSIFTEWSDERDYFVKASCDNCGYEMFADYSRRKPRVNIRNRCYYKKKCKCGEINFCLTQSDDGPEYYTTVGIGCKKCGKIVWFELPVK